MGTIIVEQFNPASGCWNKLYEVDEAVFDATVPITVNKYDGPYRTRLVGLPIIEEIVVEPVKKKFTKKKSEVPKGRFTRTAEDDSTWD